MAIVDVNFHSNCLNRMVTYKAIIPTEHKLKINRLKHFIFYMESQIITINGL